MHHFYYYRHQHFFYFQIKYSSIEVRFERMILLSITISMVVRVSLISFFGVLFWCVGVLFMLFIFILCLINIPNFIFLLLNNIHTGKGKGKKKKRKNTSSDDDSMDELDEEDEEEEVSSFEKSPGLSDNEPSDSSDDESISKARGRYGGKKTPLRKRHKRAVTPGGNTNRRPGSRMSGNGNPPRNRSSSSSRTGSRMSGNGISHRSRGGLSGRPGAQRSPPANSVDDADPGKVVDIKLKFVPVPNESFLVMPGTNWKYYPDINRYLGPSGKLQEEPPTIHDLFGAQNSRREGMGGVNPSAAGRRGGVSYQGGGEDSGYTNMGMINGQMGGQMGNQMMMGGGGGMGMNNMNMIGGQQQQMMQGNNMMGGGHQMMQGNNMNMMGGQMSNQMMGGGNNMGMNNMNMIGGQMMQGNNMMGGSQHMNGGYYYR